MVINVHVNRSSPAAWLAEGVSPPRAGLNACMQRGGAPASFRAPAPLYFFCDPRTLITSMRGRCACLAVLAQALGGIIANAQAQHLDSSRHAMRATHAHYRSRACAPANAARVVWAWPAEVKSCSCKLNVKHTPPCACGNGSVLQCTCSFKLAIVPCMPVAMHQKTCTGCMPVWLICPLPVH